ncbi:hypothetical protein PIB30_100689 [Stylosanthes scabra]|uniref:Uncharacterized protein n=1 Tax=Stylosanthes scabra TaxID=79078 RepID=A0ABU6WWU9_9FABA|nr:hypothetical protein [Stylosanthes scabra]
MVKDLGKSSKQRRGGKPKKDESSANALIRIQRKEPLWKKWVAGEVEITTKKIGDALGLSSTCLYFYPCYCGIRFCFHLLSDFAYLTQIRFCCCSISASAFCNKSGSLHPIGTPFPDKVVPKELGDEDFAVYKFFQGKTQAQLGKLIMDTPVDTIENKRLFMRAFLLFIQKYFLLATSSANVTPRAYSTLYDVKNTKQRN